MPKQILNGVQYGTSRPYVELTQAEYENLPDSKNQNGVMYFIKDGGTGRGIKCFGLADIYSEAEKEVGVWTDGKPLYQKTVDFGALPNNTDKSVDSGLTTVACIKALSAIAYAGENGFTIFIPNTELSTSGNINIAILNDRKIRIRTNYNYSSYNAIVTLQYTKTTDTPGSGSLTPSGLPAHHYSTDEQIVGTWVDGKTLYEKVITLTSTTNVRNANWTTIYTDSSIGNISQLVKVLYINSENSGVYDAFYYKPDGNNLQAILIASGNFNFVSGNKLILQYTKTTD